MRRAGIVMMGWLAINWLSATTGYAAACPQDAQKQRNADAPAKSELIPLEEKPTPGIEISRENQEDSAMLPQSARELGERFLLDQKQIWTSPANLRWSDANWLVPLSGITAGMFVTDADMSRHISRNPTTTGHYNTISNAAVAGLLGGAGTMWLLSYPKRNSHWRETGFLAGEAVVNSLVVVEGLKYPLGRERPYQGNGSGPFFQGGGTSFPSEHAAAAWAAAGVVAHEYPGPLTKIVVYSLASLVDYSRFRARQHFPSDIFVGSLIGNLVAQNVYSRHSDPELGGAEWESISRLFRGHESLTPQNMGSPYVPLDSWVYPAFDRLAALGYVNSGIFGMRPWTRLECVRLLGEAQDLVAADATAQQGAQQLLGTLEREFTPELESLGTGTNRQLRAESMYTRFTGTSGQPLNDNFHFGQTIANDFGRPLAEGFSNVAGFSGWAADGRLVVYVRGEYQYAPSSPALPLAARQLIASSDANFAVSLPLPPDTPIAVVNHFQFLDTYVAMHLENWQLSFGKQSLWWGASESGPMMFTDNAAPVTMFRIDRVSPFKLPWIFGILGPMRFEFFLGRLSGHEFIYGVNTGLVGKWGQVLDDQPFIDGVKLNFKPTRNFEFGVDYTRVTAGTGQPFTTHQFLQSLFSFGNGLPGSSSDPGDIRSGVDFQYKIPGLRNWLTFYGDAFTEDEFSPLGYPRKAAFEGGLYLPRIPGIAKLDLRVEGGSTSPVDFTGCVACFYDNGRFINSYTNQGNLMGGWIGRAAQGEQALSTYWLTSRDKIQFNYRHRKIDGQYAPGGGSVNDGEVKTDIWLNQTMELSGFVQFEKWNIPVLAPAPQSNLTASLGFTFWPHTRK
ncbi:MAG: capsule assembly Wzi family protein [Candidatus Acidiferrum sp.]